VLPDRRVQLPRAVVDVRRNAGPGSADDVRIGLFGINYGACADIAVAVAVARAAEATGFDSLWTGEHVVLPDPQVAPSPAPAWLPFLDPAIALAALAQHTKRILLGTGIIILPQRNPLVLAKEMASVDVVSGGRLLFGVGIGYLEPEFRALGIPFEDKGPRTTEYLRAMIALWTQEKPAFEGQFVSFSGINAFPRPVQKPHPPIVFGGHTRASLRRALELGSGWYGFSMDLATTAHCMDMLKETQATHGRGQGLGKLEISITPPAGLPDLETARRYSELGVDRLILLPNVVTRDDLLDYVADAGRTLVGRL